MMKRYHFYMITLLAVFTLFSLITMKVNGQGENTVAVERELYEELEEDYTQRLQEMLESKGYRNAGITMTKIYQEDGSREYTIQIHHKRIDRLDAGEKILLLNELAAIRFGDDQCIILHKFLTYEG